MKKILFICFLLINSSIFSQENHKFQNKKLDTKIINRNDNLEKIINLRKNIENDLITTTSTPTGNSSELGVLKGNISTTITGGLNYEVNLEVAPGINNIEPNISLVYNSQSGNGIAGYGWNINGISKITRIPSTKYHDGEIDPVDFNRLDRFSFDGQRLIVKNGTNGIYGANGTIYETENYSNIKITSIGVHPFGVKYGPASFLIEYPDGSIAEYGGANNSINGKCINSLEWGIVSWKNKLGTKIHYKYLNPDNVGFSHTKSLLIESIKYGSLNNDTPVNEIYFKYFTGNKIINAFINENTYTNYYLLEEINIKGNNNAIRNYFLSYESQLQYNTTNNYRKLISITEKNGDNSKVLNPIIFEYNEPTLSNLSFNSSNFNLSIADINYNNSKTLSGDFDGDGFLDIILYRNEKNKYWLFNGFQNNNYGLGVEHNVGNFREIFSTSWLNNTDNLMQKRGWCIIKHDLNSNITTFNNYSNISTQLSNEIIPEHIKSFEFPKFIVNYNNIPCDDNDQNIAIVGIDNQIIQTPTDSVITVSKEIPKIYLNGDFNGDGISDVLVIEKKVTISYQVDCSYITQTKEGGSLYFVDLDRRLISNFTNSAGLLIANPQSNYFVDDFNGDGKSDILVTDNGNYKVYCLDNNNQIKLLATHSYTELLVNSNLILGDYNGDGKTDILIPLEYGDNPDYLFLYSKGNSFTRIKRKISIPQTQNWNSGGNVSAVYHLIPSDINKDGVTDLVLVKNLYNAGNNSGFISLRTYENNGNSTYTSNMFVDTGMVNGLGLYAIPVVLNNNKKNYASELNFITNNKLFRFNSEKNFKKDHLLKSVTIGNGVKEIITYKRLIEDESEVYFSENTLTEVYPKFEVKELDELYVVSKIEKISYNQYKKRDFKYFAAVVDVNGLGFIGFKKTLSTNWYNDNFTPITTINKFDISKRGILSESIDFLGLVSGNFSNYVPNEFIRKATMIHDEQILSNKVYKINNINSTYTEGLLNTSKQIIKTYNNYNEVSSIQTISRNGSNIEFTENVTFDYYLPTYNSGNYFIGKIKSIKTSKDSDTDVPSTSETYYFYNSNNLVNEIKNKGHQTDFISQKLEYDIFGNIIKKTYLTNNLQPRILNYEYNPSFPYNGRFLTKAYDFENQILSYLYDVSNGNLLTETLPSEQNAPISNTYEYDTWGNLIKKIDYLGKQNNYNYQWLTNGFYSISTTGEDNSFSVIYFDDLDRKIAEGNKTLNDNSSNLNWKTYSFDIYDRLSKEFEPTLTFSPISSGLFNEYKYDDFGRVKEVVEFTGKISNYFYDGLTSNIIDNVNNIRIVKNSIGQVVTKEDTGGIINYTYFSNGNLKSTSFNGVDINIEQDGWGRKVKLIDPSAGTYKYEYNEFGENVIEITPNGKITNNLDDFGKIVSKTIENFNGSNGNSESYYTYNQNTKLLESIIFNNIDESYSIDYNYYYDDYRRLINTSEKRGDDLFEYITEITYDDFGRLDTERKKTNAYGRSDVVNTKNLYKNGYHWQTLDKETNQLLWKNNQVNEKGKLIDVKYGNGIKITNTFDQYGFPTQIKHDLVTNQVTNLMTLNTVFETQTGNLTSRYNSMFDYQEDFTYDSLDRLKTNKETGDLLCDCNFNSNLNGFNSVNGASVVLTNNKLSLYGTVGTLGKGTHKLVISNAQVGKKINIKGKLNIGTATAGSSIHISFYSKNPITGQLQGYTTVGMPLVNGAFNFGTTIQNENLQDLYVMFLMRNPSNPNAFMSVTLDDIKITLEKNEEQTYDDLGRIEKNNVGFYNYTNNNKVFQNTSVQLNDDSNSYFQQRSDLNITYNMFKSPVDIIEENHGKYSFTYNIANNRSSMYYGGIEENKFDRPLHKHYSTDGSVEIKYDNINDRVEFITYIGGDAYSAPIIYKSDGESGEYLYLLRDYLGSIVAISDQTGTVVEKRLFDAWGNIIKIEDGYGHNLDNLTIINRGYTGHEHLQSVNLIHMNGRLYDPIIHRFLQPDNNIQNLYNTQNYNRYSYVFNNPLKYVDITGETAEDGGLSNGQQTGIGAVISAIGLSYDFLTKSDWSKKNLNIKNWGNSINKATNFIGRNLESVGGWFNKNFESIFGGKDMVYLATSPSFSNHQLSSGWQNEGFQSVSDFNFIDTQKPTNIYDSRFFKNQHYEAEVGLRVGTFVDFTPFKKLYGFKLGEYRQASYKIESNGYNFVPTTENQRFFDAEIAWQGVSIAYKYNLDKNHTDSISVGLAGFVIEISINEYNEVVWFLGWNPGIGIGTGIGAYAEAKLGWSFIF